MKYIISAVLALSLAIGIPVSAQQSIDLRGGSYSTWISSINKDLDRGLFRHRSFDRFASEGSGIVRIRFTCSEEGKPDNISFYSSSGDSRLDRRAWRAVSRIKSLHPMPSGVSDKSIFQANIILAKNQREFYRLYSELEKMENQRIASSPREKDVLALGVDPQLTSS